MLTRMRNLGVVVAACLLALSGCSAVPDNGATPTPTHSSMPPAATESTPSVQPTVSASIVISATSIQILDGSGAVLSENSYFDPTAGVVAVLSDAFGSEPTVEQYEGHGDNWPGTSYEWDGFMLRDIDLTVQAPYYPEFQVFVEGKTVGDVSLTAVGGIAIGDSFAEAAAANPDHAVPSSSFLQVDWTELPPFSDASTPAVSVGIVDDDADGAVNRIIAPSANWGA